MSGFDIELARDVIEQRKAMDLLEVRPLDRAYLGETYAENGEEYGIAVSETETGLLNRINAANEKLKAWNKLDQLQEKLLEQGVRQAERQPDGCRARPGSRLAASP